MTLKMTVPVHLDWQCFDHKPADEDAERMTVRMESWTEIEVEQLAETLTQPHGRSFTPACYHYRRSIQNWQGQQLIALDFDEGLSITDVIERCDEYGMLGNIHPAFAYTTFSSQEQERFRVVWTLGRVIMDYRAVLVVQNMLYQLFPEADPYAKDAVHLFYGGKEIVYRNYDSVVNPEHLVDSTCLYIQTTTKNGNASRKIKKVFADLGVVVTGGLPDLVSVLRDENAPVAFIDVKGNGSKTSSPSAVVVRKTLDMKFVDGYTDEMARLGMLPENSETAEENARQVSLHQRRRPVLKDVDWAGLGQRCSLFQDFMTGNRWLYYPELFGLATNLIHMEGGVKKFFEGLESRPEYRPKIPRFKKAIDIMIRRDYQPKSFAGFSVASEIETGAKNLVLAARLKKGDIVVVEPIIFKPKEEIVRSLRAALDVAMAATGHHVHMIKAPTGIGKTEMCIGIENALIAVPTHKLKQEIYLRWKEKGFDVVVTPELPEDLDVGIRRNIERLYRIGASRAVQRYLRSLMHMPQVAEYVEQMRAVENAGDRTVITTHERLMFLRELKPTIIIDEDPFQTLLKQGMVNRDEVIAFLSWAGLTKGLDQHAVRGLRTIVENAEEKRVYEMSKMAVDDIDAIEESVIGVKLSTNVIGFLHSDLFTVVGDVIHFIKRRDLPTNRKVIILSATVSEKVYRQMLGDRLSFVDLGHCELMGEITQYPMWSFSKRFMKENLRAVDMSKNILRDTPIITSKEMVKFYGREKVAATFGGLAGLDHLGGQHIGICGTYHLNPIAYLLFANALGLRVEMDECVPRLAQIERNGYRFWFNTFIGNEMLGEIQLYLVESELMQAVGRARLVNNEATVTVFSNFPVPGARFEYMIPAQIRSMLERSKQGPVRKAA